MVRMAQICSDIQTVISESYNKVQFSELCLRIVKYKGLLVAVDSSLRYQAEGLICCNFA